LRWQIPFPGNFLADQVVFFEGTRMIQGRHQLVCSPACDGNDLRLLEIIFTCPQAVRRYRNPRVRGA
jgi:hypothetical protein